ncbi:hypothetical protein [Streptomyces sp. URMC 129]|uniref:hypothetical protein n=1 Tax=Streptomyces sp. URMC 129 TaxID=3423407 RepID=UPI003F1A3620
MNNPARDPARGPGPPRTPRGPGFRASDAYTSSATGRLMRDLRRMPLFRQLVPMEAFLAWPAPLRRPGPRDRPAVLLRFPLFGGRRAPGGTGLLLHPPFATLTVDRRTRRITEYTDLRYTRPRPWPMPGTPGPVGTFPRPDAPWTTVGDYLADVERLLLGYDALLHALDEGRALPEPDAATFAGLLGRLVEPGLAPYLRALAPAFFSRFLGPEPDPAQRPGQDP